MDYGPLLFILGEPANHTLRSLGIVPIKSNHPNSADFNTAVFSTSNLPAAVERLKQNGVKILGQEQSGKGSYVMLEDPFGNVSKLLEVK